MIVAPGEVDLRTRVIADSWTVESPGNIVFTVNFQGVGQPMQIEFQLTYNGQPVQFESPLILTIQ